MFQYSLNDSAAISMNAQGVDMVSHRLNDEVECFGWHLLNAFLDHMVPILVVNAI